MSIVASISEACQQESADAYLSSLDDAGLDKLHRDYIEHLFGSDLTSRLQRRLHGREQRLLAAAGLDGVRGEADGGGTMKFEIKSRWSSSVLFSIETDSWKLAVEAALKAGANLRNANLGNADLMDADLRNADLTDADLRGADLTDADLRNADLRNADLRNANLTGANLTDANLTDANLRGANLRGADLRNANLKDADLRGADLTDADLRGADLTDADLTPIRDDFWAVLSSAAGEVSGLRQALIEGKIDGSCYEGECACLVGTIANLRHQSYLALDGLKPNKSRPAERFFLGIGRGDTPENNQAAALAVKWIEQWMTNVRAAIATAEVSA